MLKTLSMGELYDLLSNLSSELDDSVSFMETLGDFEIEETQHRKESKKKLVDLTRKILAELNKEYKELLAKVEDDGSYRFCDECKNVMTEGYCIDGGSAYYCSVACRDKHMTEDEFLELYDDGEGDSYWTDWHIYIPIEFRFKNTKSI